MVGRLVSFWDGVFAGVNSLLVSGRVNLESVIQQMMSGKTPCKTRAVQGPTVEAVHRSRCVSLFLTCGGQRDQLTNSGWKMMARSRSKRIENS